MNTRESLERAAKFDFECTGSDDHDCDNCRKCAGMRDALAALLDEVRMEEHDLGFEPSGYPKRSSLENQERRAELEAKR